MAQSPQPAQPRLSELLARYLRQPAHPRTSREVELHNLLEVSVDLELSWAEATRVLSYWHPDSKVGALQPPEDWSFLVENNQHELVAATPFALGNYPQIVRNVQSLLQGGDLSSLRPAKADAWRAGGVSPSRESDVPGRQESHPGLQHWADKLARKGREPQTLLAAGVLRLARHFDEAGELLERAEKAGASKWLAARSNEKAALAWHRGDAEAAADLWRSQAGSVPVLFNRGMADLFLGKAAKARSWLGKVVEQLPDDDGWHHLGRLYLVLAEMIS
jgi:tetratricopeptide (TPR) repeat protein